MIRNKQIPQGETINSEGELLYILLEQAYDYGQVPTKISPSDIFPLGLPPIHPVLPLAKPLLVVSSPSYPGHHNNSSPGPTSPSTWTPSVQLSSLQLLTA